MGGADGGAAAPAAGRAHHPPRPAAGDGDHQRDARQFLGRRRSSPMPRPPPKPAPIWPQEGAAIIDVGGESTRPGARSIWEGDEIERVVPVIRQLVAGGAAVSVDTRKADVMTAALAAGARHDQRRVGADLRRALGRDGRGGEGAGGADAPPGRARGDAGRSALRRCAGRGLSMARGADRGGESSRHRARA